MIKFGFHLKLKNIIFIGHIIDNAEYAKIPAIRLDFLRTNLYSKKLVKFEQDYLFLTTDPINQKYLKSLVQYPSITLKSDIAIRAKRKPNKPF